MPALSLSGQSRQRQIVILAVGGLVLGALLLFQIPRTLERLNPPASTAPEATQTTAAPATAQPEAAPATPVVPVATTPSPRQAPALSRFKSKDPFVQQVDPNPSPATPPAAATTPAASASQKTAEAEAAPASFTVESRGRAVGSATISVNGVGEKVKVAGTFPKGNRVFRLVSLRSNAARIGIAGGTLKGGSQTVTLMKGEPLTLLNTVDGKRYRLELR